MNHQVRSTPAQLFIAFALFAYGGQAALAAEQASTASTGTWGVVIMLLVLASTAGSAVLNIAAIRQWDRNWGLVSGLPLLGLALWCLLILIAKRAEPDAHALWLLEIFAWAMINMIYMVTAMTAKRMFAKRDSEETAKVSD